MSTGLGLCFVGLALGVLPTEAVECDSELGESGTALRNPAEDVPSEWLTMVERTEFRQTPRYDDTVAFCRRLADASEWIDYQSFGKSGEGRDLPLLIASKNKAFTPASARAAGKLVVLIQNGIHSGECEGKDASLMLVRDLGITRACGELLERIVLLVIPIFNVDGHERFSPYSRINQNGPEAMGWRVTARNLNLNRDYMKADTVEMRAWLALWSAWRPDLFIDTHTTDGGDWQYDLLISSDTHEAAVPQIAGWLKEVLNPTLFSSLEADGHLPMVYFDLVDSKDPGKGIHSGGFGPRFSNGYAAVRNRPALLVETHMLKPYRTRVIGQYNTLQHTLEIVNREAGPLRTALREADEATAAIGSAYDPDRLLPVSIEGTDDSVPLTFKGYAYRRELSEVSGDVRIVYDNSKPVQFETVWHNRTRVTKEVNPPLAYIIPPQWTEVIGVLEAHGLRFRQTTEVLTGEFESYRFSDVSFPKSPYEGRFQPTFAAERMRETRTFPAGSVIVRLDQPDAKVAIHLLEPEAPDSLVSWGFFNAIFEQKEYSEDYVLEALARRMLEADPKLREEFETKVRTDRAFASNPHARLYFFYQRSPYWDGRKNVYPVGRIIDRKQVGQ